MSKVLLTKAQEKALHLINDNPNRVVANSGRKCPAGFLKINGNVENALRGVVMNSPSDIPLIERTPTGVIHSETIHGIDRTWELTAWKLTEAGQNALNS